MVILRLRVSLCCMLGSILSRILSFYPTGPRLHRAAELWQYRVFGISNCVFFHYYRRVPLAFPPFTRPLNQFTTVPTISAPSAVSIPE